MMIVVIRILFCAIAIGTVIASVAYVLAARKSLKDGSVGKRSDIPSGFHLNDSSAPASSLDSVEIYPYDMQDIGF